MSTVNRNFRTMECNSCKLSHHFYSIPYYSLTTFLPLHCENFIRVKIIKKIANLLVRWKPVKYCTIYAWKRSVYQCRWGQRGFVDWQYIHRGLQAASPVLNVCMHINMYEEHSRQLLQYNHNYNFQNCAFALLLQLSMLYTNPCNIIVHFSTSLVWFECMCVCVCMCVSVSV